MYLSSLVEVPDDDDDKHMLPTLSMPISMMDPTHLETIEISAVAAAAKDNALPALMPESMISPCPQETIEAASDATNATEDIFHSAVEKYNSVVAHRWHFNYES